MTIGQRLKQLRESKQMTQAETAKAVEAATRGVIANWEADKTTPRPQFLQAYANYFNVPIDWIRYGDFDEFCNKVLTYAIETDIPHPLYMELKRLLDITAQRYAINEEPKEDAQTRLETFKEAYGDSLIKKIKGKGAVYDEDSVLQVAINVITDTLNSSGAELFNNTIKDLKTMKPAINKMMNSEKLSDDREALKKVDNDITALLNSLDKLLNQ